MRIQIWICKDIYSNKYFFVYGFYLLLVVAPLLINGFFVKNVSMKDKRMKVYRLNGDSKVSVESWLEGRKKLYES